MLYQQSNLVALLAFVGPIIGVLVSSVVSLLIESSRNDGKVKRDHLYDIKEKCLKPIKTSLAETYSSYFDFIKEMQELPDAKGTEKFLNGTPVHWWNESSIDVYVFGAADDALYKDLVKHSITRDIPPAVMIARKSVMGNMPKLLNAYVKLYKKIDSSPEFRRLDLGDNIGKKKIYN